MTTKKSIQDQIREQLAALENKKTTPITTDKPKTSINQYPIAISDGVTQFRILPSPEEGVMPFISGAEHFLEIPSKRDDKDKSKVPVICVKNTQDFDGACPICEYSRALLEMGDKDNSAKYQPQTKGYCNVLIVKSVDRTSTKYESLEPSLLSLRYSEHMEIMRQYLGTDPDEDVSGFSTGRTLKATRTKTGVVGRFGAESKTVFILTPYFSVLDEEQITEIKKTLKRPLDAFVRGRDTSYEEAKKVLDLHIRYKKDPEGTIKEVKEQAKKEQEEWRANQNKKELVAEGEDKEIKKPEVSIPVETLEKVEVPMGSKKPLPWQRATAVQPKEITEVVIPDGAPECFGKDRDENGNWVGYNELEPRCMTCSFDAKCSAISESKK